VFDVIHKKFPIGVFFEYGFKHTFKTYRPEGEK